MRHGPRFSNTGLGQQPTLSELSGLTRAARRKGCGFAEATKRIKAAAKTGDPAAVERLKHHLLATAGGASTRMRAKYHKPTKVTFSFMEEND